MHSKFIFNSIENVGIYDLENMIFAGHGLNDVINDCNAEGYFRDGKLSGIFGGMDIWQS